MKEKVVKIGKFIFYLSAICLAIFAFIYRTKVWLFEPGFFGDEGALILNIQNRTFWQLFLPLDGNQCCPPLLMCVFKLIYSLFGMNETALRFFPYITGFAACILAFFVGNKVFKFKSSTLCLMTCMIFSNAMIYYSQEFKQYSSDVFFSLLIPFVFLLVKDKITTNKRAVLFGVFLGLSGFICLPAEFVVVPICFYFLFKYLKGKNYKHLLCMALPYILLSLSLFFLMILDTLKGEMLGLSMWAEGCDVFNSVESVKSFAKYVYGYCLVVVMSVMFVFGMVYLLLRERFLILIFGLPILINIILGYCHLYPFVESRAILWLMPFAMIISLKSFDFLKTKNDISNIIVECLIFLFFILNLCLFVKVKIVRISDAVPYYFYRSNAKEYVKKLEKQSVKPDDIIFVDFQGQGIFGIYDIKHKYHGTNVVYQNFEEDFGYYDSRIKDESKREDKTLDDFPVGTCIWFYNSKIYGNEVSVDNINQWIQKNTKILLKEDDTFGEFYYVQKIK